MSRVSAYTYGEDGKWTPVTDNSSSTDNSSKDSSKEDSTPTTTNTGGDNLSASTSDKDSSTGTVEKELNEVEINTLSGTLNFIATEKTIKLKAGDTVSLQGLGKYLSGNYYVKEVTRNISSNGYEHSATVIKTDFGKSLKSTSSSDNGNNKEEKTVSSTHSSDSANRTYTVVKGDSLWKIAKQYYGNGSQYHTIYDANTDKIVNPDLIYVGQVLVIP